MTIYMHDMTYMCRYKCVVLGEPPRRVCGYIIVVLCRLLCHLVQVSITKIATNVFPLPCHIPSRAHVALQLFPLPYRTVHQLAHVFQLVFQLYILAFVQKTKPESECGRRV